MEKVAEDVFGRGCFWCPRCGTIRTSSTGEVGETVFTTDVPALVQRCRTFEAEVVGTYGAEPVEGEDTVRSEWHRLGVAQSINPPENRPDRPPTGGPS